MIPDVAERFQKHCPGCFQLKGGVAVCPHCGYDESSARSPLFLPHGTILGGQYRVGRVLGRPGGFGITYLGWDVNLQQRVAIKEYLPREIAQRMPNSLEVNVHTSDDRRGFEFGKEQFLREARIVAKLDHPNIVRVRNFFNANSTAYLVMDYYEGMSLGDYLTSVRTKLEPELAVPLIKPILEGLQYVHERGLVHRDLKPHNIYLAAIGRPIVLDFGAARQAAGDRVQSLSVVLTEGYAPLEQYQRRAVQGPWTDVYGVAATLYRMIAGAAPPIALDRIGRDPVDEGGWSSVPSGLVPAMRMALAVRPSDRYQSAAEFHLALDRYVSSTQSVPATVAEAMPAAEELVPPTKPVPPAPEEPITGERAPSAEYAVAPLGGGRKPPASTGMPRAIPQATRELSVPVPPVVPLIPSRSAPTPTVTPPAPTEPVATRSPAALPPQPAVSRPRTGAGEPTGLGILADAPPEAPTTTKLHRRADDLRTQPTNGRRQSDRKPDSGSRWPVTALALVAAAVVIYVLLNPPGKSRMVTPPVAVAPAPVVPAPAPIAPVPETVDAVPATGAAVSDAATVPPQTPIMVDLPGGDLVLSEPASATDGGAASRTVHVGPFRIGLSEVTVAQFREFVTRTGYDNPRWQNYPCESAGGRLPDWKDPGYAQREDFPVVCVSWADANAYTQWLSRETGQAYRLPTEAEWEYAARGGTRAHFWWGNDFNEGMAACQSCPPKVPTQPSATQSFPANPFGLYETLGNVREWTCSLFDRYSTPAASQCGMPDAQSRVSVRGGSWQQVMETLAAGYREAYEPYRRNVWTGFRVAQELRAPVAR